MYIRAPTSVGVCSISYPGILMLFASGFFCESLLSVMHIISNLVLRRLRKLTTSNMCKENDEYN